MYCELSRNYGAEAVMELEQDKYELFRSAIVDRDDDAWTLITAFYRPMMITWAARSLAVQIGGECCEDLADQALARAWAALSPEHFASFPNLAAFLAYLRTCVATAAIDAIRSQAKYERAFERGEQDSGATPEQLVLERLESTQLWQLVTGVIASDAERVAVHERFVLDLPPRIIQRRHPMLFADVKLVYAAIRNICARLERHKDVRQLYSDHSAT
jgi:DNA-directed RNA polymerase specialized sigma24 family protein